MKPIVVCGHICLDVFPSFPRAATSLETLLAPGKLVEVGPAVMTPGGAVANTGLALHRFGLPVRLVAKVGDDAFGRNVLEIFRAAGAPTEGLVVDGMAATSYTVVLSPVGCDRIFLHCPSANDCFGAADVRDEVLTGAALFHFGYPPLMQRMYATDGTELETLLRRVRAAGVTTSLDLALPDPDSKAGQADWGRILRRVLPHVDVFLPSLDELVFMLDRPRCAALRQTSAQGAPLGGLTVDEVRGLADQAIGMGAALILIKLGVDGIYFQATTDQARLRACGAVALDPRVWSGASGHAPSFEVEVAGTTGAGDCTIAGFLAALVQGVAPDEAARMAVATGAASVEQQDATSGIPPWPQLVARMAAGWKRRPPRVTFPRLV